MNTPTPRTTPAASREALAESEREASRTHPENFKQDETADKVVEVLPIDDQGAAIRGIDPDQ